ncbi:MAG: hypothetical protein HUU01_06110 [Saprospiraceae bacterium]|nr:hypothetical protein [Saprospiraceae bacterium]
MQKEEFLFSIIGIILALAISNLIKGFDLLLKYKPATQKPMNENRWMWRLLWFVNLTLLISQFVWGIRLKIEEINLFYYFIYYIVLTGLIYAIIVYIFPENVEELYKNELQVIDEEAEIDRKKLYTKRLTGFYYIFITWLLSTVIVNFVFYFKNNDNIIEFLGGITLKAFCIYLIGSSIRKKAKGELDISKTDYMIIFLSIIIHIWYFIIRI